MVYTCLDDTGVTPFDEFDKELHKVLLEIDDEGRVNREIGLNKEGEIIHRFPSSHFKYGSYGLFDLTKFELNFKSDDEVEKIFKM
jgi:hypothetical protein